MSLSSVFDLINLSFYYSEPFYPAFCHSEKVRKCNSSPVIDSVNLKIDAGDFVILVGESGSGKTTLLKILAGLLPRSRMDRVVGKILYEGRPMASFSDWELRSKLAFSAEDTDRQLLLSRVSSELAFAPRNLSLSHSEVQFRVKEIAQSLKIEHLLDRRVSSLSDGEKHKVSLGSLLTLAPSVLCLDEPSSKLSPQSTRELSAVLSLWSKGVGKTLIVAEHNWDRLLPYATKVIHLSKGSICFCGSPNSYVEFYQSHTVIRNNKVHNFRTPKRVEHENGIVVRNACYTYAGGETVGPFDFSSEFGSATCITGENGSGKTTLLKLIFGVLKPSLGTVTFNQKHVSSFSDKYRIRILAYHSSVSSRCFLSMTIKEELAVLLKSSSKSSIFNAIESLQYLAPLVKEIRLLDRLDENPHNLSCGNRRIFSLILTFLRGMPVVLLDEPTNGCSKIVKHYLAQMVDGFVADGGIVICATHDIDFVSSISHKRVSL